MHLFSVYFFINANFVLDFKSNTLKLERLVNFYECNNNKVECDCNLCILSHYLKRVKKGKVELYGW
jgi:hypothetical protein